MTADKCGIDAQTEVLLALQSGDFKKAAEIMIGRYRDTKTPLSLQDRSTLADMVVIAFEDFPRLRDVNPELHEELSVVRRSLECVCAGRFTDALAELKSIKMQCIFAGWRLFLKGVCAFYRGEDTEALEAFQRLNNKDLLSKAARPFVFVINGGSTVIPREEPKEQFLVQVLRVLNRSDMVHALPQAEYLWRLGRHADSYDHMARTFNGFPAENNGTAGTLTRFYFNVPFHMEYERAEKYMAGIHPIIVKKRDFFTGHLLFGRMRNLLPGAGEEIPDRDLLRVWEEFLTAYASVHGENSKVSALVHAHLGNIFSSETGDSGGDDPLRLFFKPGKRRFETGSWQKKHTRKACASTGMIGRSTSAFWTFMEKRVCKAKGTKSLTKSADFSLMTRSFWRKTASSVLRERPSLRE